MTQTQVKTEKIKRNRKHQQKLKFPNMVLTHNFDIHVFMLRGDDDNTIIDNIIINDALAKLRVPRPSMTVLRPLTSLNISHTPWDHHRHLQ